MMKITVKLIFKKILSLILLVIRLVGNKKEVDYSEKEEIIMTENQKKYWKLIHKGAKPLKTTSLSKDALTTLEQELELAEAERKAEEATNSTENSESKRKEKKALDDNKSD